jgi:TonB-dependent SusC/RagA subfamily outer membrane receptor
MRLIQSPALRALLAAALTLSVDGGCAHGPQVPGRATAPDSGASTPERAMRADDAAAAGAQPASARTVDVEAMSGAGGAARIEELLVGRVAGVRVVSVPGGVVIRIRGRSTLMGQSDPLYIVDGMPVDVGPGGLLEINPSEIASIEVLKDAASTSFYGMRGANGVILIRTRR